MADRALVGRRLCVLIVAAVWFLGAPGATAQSSADPASLQRVDWRWRRGDR